MAHVWINNTDVSRYLSEGTILQGVGQQPWQQPSSKPICHQGCQVVRTERRTADVASADAQKRSHAVKPARCRGEGFTAPVEFQPVMYLGLEEQYSMAHVY
jgi:hypothetical protein